MQNSAEKNPSKPILKKSENATLMAYSTVESSIGGRPQAAAFMD
jgi:hypothetical protein